MTSFIETVNHWGDLFLNSAWPMFWQSSLLIAIIFVLDFVLRRKIRAAIRYALWLMVLVKLLLPPSLALPTSLAWWVLPTPPAPAKPQTTTFVVTYGDSDQSTPIFPLQSQPIPPPIQPKLSSAAWTLAASGVISAGLLAWLMVRWWQINRKSRRAKTSEQLIPILDETRRSAHLRPDIRLKLTEGSMSPAVCGLFRPVILLPQSLVEKLSAGQLRAVLLHEAIHLRRGDVWVNCAQALLQIVYWWHPLLWLTNARIRRAREEAVDDAVMLALREDADIYAPTLLEVAKFAFRRPLASLGLVGILESRSALRQRIERLMDFDAPRKAGLTIVSILGILVFSVVALPMGQAPEKTNAPTDSVSNFEDATNASETALKVNGNMDSGVLSNANFRAAIHAVEQRTGVEKLAESKATTASGRQVPLRSANTVQQVNYNPALQSDVSLTRIFKINNPTNKIGLKKLLAEAGVKIPPTLFVYINNGILLARGSEEQLDLIERVVLNLNGFSTKQANGNNSVKRPPFTEPLPHVSTNLEMRGFKVDTNVFARALRSTPGIQNDDVPRMAESLFNKLGVDLTVPGRNIAYNDKMGLLFVRATESELDTVMQIVQALDQVPTQIHIKTRFIEVPEDEVGAILQAGTAVDTNTVEIIGADKMKSLLHQLATATGTKELAEPGAVTGSGRQTQMRSDNSTVDLVPRLLDDGYTLNLETIVSKPGNLTARVNIWDGQTLALVFPNSNGKNRLVVFVTSWIVDPAGNRVHSDDELRQMQEKAKSDTPPQHTLILSDTNFQARIHALEQRTRVESLAEPKAVATAGRQVQLRLANSVSQQTQNVSITGRDLSTNTNASEEKLKADHLIQDGKALYLAGKFDESQKKFKQAIELDPTNQAAAYYLSVVYQASYAREQLSRRGQGSNAMAGASQALSPTNVFRLPMPNSFVTTSPAHEAIYQKLNSIHLDSISWPDGTSLSEVIRYLAQQSKLLDPEKKGINFVFNPNTAANSAGAGPVRINPATGLPEPATTNSATPEIVDPNSINVKLTMKNISLYNVLDAIVLVADRPIQYSVEDFAVVFSPKPPGQQKPDLETRIFRIDKNTFVAGMTNIALAHGIPFPNFTGLQTDDVAGMAERYFNTFGVDLTAPGRNFAYKDRLGQLFVTATPSELDVVQSVIQTLNQVPPQVHIKARFIEVPKEGFVAMPQLSSNAVAGQITGIMSVPELRKVLQALEHRNGLETLAEPECVTTSGRQTQMRATEVRTFLNGINPLALKPPGVSSNEVFLTKQVECGPVFDVVPYVLADGYTINLTATASVTEFLGYDKPTNSVTVYINGKKQTVPMPLPKFRTRKISTVANMWDNQTLVFGGPDTLGVQTTKDKVPLLGDLPLVGGLFRSQKEISVENKLMVFVTATIVDQAGNRVHSDDELHQIQEKTKSDSPPQPQISTPSR